MNSLGIDLKAGQKVILKKGILKPEYDSQDWRTVELVDNDSFGMSSYTTGTSILIRFRDGTETTWNAMQIESLVKPKWYVSKSAYSDQGLVVDESTGENIAVSYKKENAPILAAAPQAIDLLAETLDLLNNMASNDPHRLTKEAAIQDKIARFLDEVANSGN